MRVLLLDPDPESRDALRRSFGDTGDQVRSVGTLAEASRHLGEFLPDAVIAAAECPDGDGLDLLESALRGDPRRAVYALVPGDHLEAGVAAMERVAQDFLWRPVSPGRVALLRSRLAARREREGWLEETRLRLARAEMASSLVGRSPRWRSAVEAIERVAAIEAPVLLTGEGGTEKEEAARALHRLSSRGSEPFFVLADGEPLPTPAAGGALFVPALERVATEVQRNLLHAGSGPRAARLLAATDEDPRRAVSGGSILPELFESFDGHGVHLPPLRERGSDVELLARHFLHALDGSLYFEPEAIDALKAHDWPGNVRELKEVVRRACQLGEGPALGPTVVTSVLGRPLASRRSGRKRTPVVRIAVGQSLADVERRLLQKTLEFARGNKKLTARLLQLSLKTIYNKIKEYGLEH